MKRKSKKQSVFWFAFVVYVKSLMFAGLVCMILYAFLEFTGIYAWLETALDLKYNSPYVWGPMLVFAFLSLLCFAIGGLLYFCKYIRTKTKSVFQKYMSGLLSKKQIE